MISALSLTVWCMGCGIGVYQGESATAARPMMLQEAHLSTAAPRRQCQRLGVKGAGAVWMKCRLEVISYEAGEITVSSYLYSQKRSPRLHYQVQDLIT